MIEKRWECRFGKEQIDRLRALLCALVTQFEVNLPDCLPILGYGLFSRGPEKAAATATKSDWVELSLAALFAKALLEFAVEFERQADMSLAISANILRLLDREGVRLRDLPTLSGVSKEAIRMALGFLQKMGCIGIGIDPTGGSSKAVSLTAKGQAAKEAYWDLTAIIEKTWQTRFGKKMVANLRRSLEELACESGGCRSMLLSGLSPYPDNWRASVPQPSTLPHYPMVLHRGGFPDGS